MYVMAPRSDDSRSLVEQHRARLLQLQSSQQMLVSREVRYKFVIIMPSLSYFAICAVTILVLERARTFLTEHYPGRVCLIEKKFLFF